MRNAPAEVRGRRERPERGVDRTPTGGTECHVRRRRGQHEPRHAIRVPSAQELRDGSAHGVPRDHDRTAVQRAEQHREVVGAVGEAERLHRAEASRVASQVGCQHPELLPQRLERPEPVQTAARHPAVQQEEHGRARGTGHLTDERRAPPRQLDPPAQRQRRPRSPVGSRSRFGDAIAHQRAKRVDRMPPHHVSPRSAVRTSSRDHRSRHRVDEALGTPGSSTASGAGLLLRRHAHEWGKQLQGRDGRLPMRQTDSPRSSRAARPTGASEDHRPSEGGGR